MSTTRIIQTLVILLGALLIAPASALGKPAKAPPPPPQLQPSAPKAKKPKPVRVQVAPASRPADDEGEPAPSRRVQRMSFEDEDIEATREGGAGTVVGGERRAKHSSLIHVREDFIDQLVKSAEDI